MPLSLVLAAAACSKPAADTAAEAATAGTAPATADAAAAAPAGSASKPVDMSATDDHFVLTMDKFDAYYATIAKLSDQMMAAGDEAEDMDDATAMDASESVDQYIARVEADPRARALITSAGMSVSDYAHTNEALLAGMMMAGALESGALKTIPDGVDPQYVKFAQVHKAELAAKVAALQARYTEGE
jgi:hypothetical protein